MPDEISFDIRREGYPWPQESARERYYMAPEKIELIAGKMFWNDEERLRVLGLLLENVGADAAVRLGDPEVWRAAVRGLE